MNNFFDYLYNNKHFIENVYIPSEDTFIFTEALKEELNFFINKNVFLEMGAGSGYITFSLKEMFKKNNKKNDFFFCIDVNEISCECIKKYAKINKIQNIEIINNYLFKSINIFKLFDVIIFNPPYVPTEPNEMKKNNITASYAGGKLGREIIFEFLFEVYDFLNDKGTIYLLLEKQNLPYDIINHSKIKDKFICYKIKEKKILNETIFIFKFIKKPM